MAVTTSFLSSATNERYNAQALTYVGSTVQRQFIQVTALALGVSSGAIAGAMAEENSAYWQNKVINDGLDDYALGKLLNQAPWTHEQWLADYNLVGGDTGEIASAADKLRNPVVIDMGQANFKMTTAIRLVQERSGSVCLNNFPRSISGLQADWQRRRVTHGVGRRLRRADRRGG